MEYYSEIKKKKIVSFARKWIEWEIMILSEISEAQKENITFSLVCRIQFNNNNNGT
jgi:hypothetical protein